MADTPRKERLTPPDDEEEGGPWSIRIGEAFNFGKYGSFTVKNRLGRGGMGEVYRAEYVAPSAREFVQEYALKVLRPGARPYEGRHFIDEVHLLSLLRHNHVARYHTYFLDHGRQVLVMEYVEGRSLHSLLKLARRKGRTLGEHTSLELLVQVAEALGYAHAAKDEKGRPLNIVHRDISPANIMVTSAGFAKLVDFGIAKPDLDGRTQTRAGVIEGKSPYLSPEQVELRRLDGRSDLFSLCSVLVEMLTGEPPFGRTGDPATVRSSAQVTPRYVDQVTRGLSKKVRALCRKGLARDPAQRFADGREMARALYDAHSYQGPPALLAEIEALEAATALQRVKRARRTLAAIGALALASLGGVFLCGAAHSRPAAPATLPPAAAVSSPVASSPNAAEGMTAPSIRNAR